MSDTICSNELVGPFIRSTKDVFGTMLDAECRIGEVQPVKSGHQMLAVTSMIGLTGGITGSIAVSTSRDGAIQILERMAGLEATELDECVLDAVGEISNMIAGQGKRELAHYSLSLGLPQVIVGEDCELFSPGWAEHYWLSLETDLGPCTLDIGFNLS